MRIFVLLFGGIFLTITAAQAGNREAIIGSCINDLQMSPSQCDCIADETEKVFDEKKMKFFLAMISSDTQKKVAAMSTLSPEERIEVGRQMELIPPKCGGN